MLRRDDDRSRRIARDVTRENARVNDKDVVCAVHLGIGVDDGGAIVHAAVVGAHLGGAHPVVGPARRRRDGERVDVVRGGLVGGGLHPGQAGDTGQGGLHVLNAFDDGFFVAVVVEEGACGDGHVERGAYGGAAARNLAAAEVLGDCHGFCTGR